MDAKLARLYRERWNLVAEIEKEELRSATLEERCNMMDAVYRLGKGLGSLEKLLHQRDDEPVRARWTKLKKRAQGHG